MTDCTSCNSQKFTKFNYKVYVSDNLEIQEREIPDLGTCITFSNKGTCAREKNFEDGKKQQQLQPYPMDRQNYCCQEQGCRTSGGNPTGGVEKVKRRRVSKAKRSLEPGMEQLLFTSTFSPRANRS